MRLGGAYPFGQPPVPIALKSGQIFYPPPGNFAVSLGSTTILQYFDPQNMMWRVLGSPGQSFDYVDFDGYNFRFVNASGICNGALITNAGSGGTNGIGTAATGVTVGFGSAPTNGVAATAYPIVGGAINTTIAITNAGSGFLMPPALLLDPPPPGGIQATAVCTISTAGVISAVTVTNAGGGYTTVPNCYVIPQWLTYQGVGAPVNAVTPVQGPPPGLVAAVVGNNSFPTSLPFIQYPPAVSGGAVLTVNPTLAGSGTLTGIVMQNYGANYLGTAIPTIAFTGGGLAGGVAATAIMSFSLLSLTITNGGAAYSVAPIWESSYGLVAFTDGCNGTYQPRPARGVSGVSGGIINANTIEDQGFGLQKVPVIGVIQAGGTVITTAATLTPVVGGVTDVSLIGPAVQ